jgi:hypothetical protein
LDHVAISAAAHEADRGDQPERDVAPARAARFGIADFRDRVRSSPNTKIEARQLLSGKLETQPSRPGFLLLSRKATWRIRQLSVAFSPQ